MGFSYEYHFCLSEYDCDVKKMNSINVFQKCIAEFLCSIYKKVKKEIEYISAAIRLH